MRGPIFGSSTSNLSPRSGIAQAASQTRSKRRSRVASRGSNRFEALERRTLLSTWTGNGASGNWSDAGNWDVPPVPGETINFPALAASKNTVFDLPDLFAINRMNFSGTGYSIASGSQNGRIAVGAGGIFVNDFNGAHDITARMELSGSSVPIQVVETSRLTLAGIVTGAATLAKGAGGTLALSGNNNSVDGIFEGVIQANDGVIEVHHANALGGTAQQTITNGGALLLTAAATGGSEPLSLGNSGFEQRTLFTDAGPAVTWTGSVLLEGPATVSVAAGNTLTFANGVTQGPNGQLFKRGAGRLVLTRTAAGGTITLGGAEVAQGVLRMGGSGTLNNTNVAAGAALELEGGINVSGGGLRLSGNGFNDVGGALLNVAGTNTWNGTVALNAGSTISSAAGSLIIPLQVDNRGFDLIVGGAGSTTLSNRLTGAGALNKNGTGTLTLAGSTTNDYTGTTLVSSGVVVAQKDTAFGSTAAATIVAAGGAVHLPGGVTVPEAFTITGTGSGLGNTTGALLNLAGLNTFAGTVTLAGAATIGAAAGTGTFSNTINNGGALLTVNAAPGATVAVTGAIAGAGGLTKNGTGALQLSGNGANTYTGTTLVNAGPIVVQKVSALGNAGVNSTTTVNAGGAVHFHTDSGERFTIRGTGVGNSGALLNLDGSNTLTGAIVLGANAMIATANQLFAIEGTVANAGFTLTASSNVGTQLRFNNTLSGAGGFTKTGGGEARLAGNANNTYTGTTRANQGTLVLAKGAGVNAFGGSLVVGDDGGGNASDTVVLAAANQIPAVAVTVSRSGFLNLAGFSDAIGALSIADGGAIATGVGTLTVGGTVTNLASTSPLPAIIAGNLSLGTATRTFSVSGQLVVNAVIAGDNSTVPNPGLSKTGAGTLNLADQNTYTGSTSATGGTLLVDGKVAGAVTVSGVSRGTAVIGGTGVVQSLTLNSGGILDPGAPGSTGVFTVDGSLTFGVGSVYRVQVIDGAQHDTVAVRAGPTRINTLVAPQLNITLGLGLLSRQSVVLIAQLPGSNLSGEFNVVSTPTFSPSLFTFNYKGGTGQNNLVMTRNFVPFFPNRAVTPAIVEGGVVTLTGQISDPDPDDTFFLDVDWGDGSIETFEFPPGSPTNVAVQHQYLDDPVGNSDRIPIHVAWRDDFGAGREDTLYTQVSNATPVLHEMILTHEGAGLVRVSGWATDAGVLDALSLEVKWGDGSIEQYALESGHAEIDLTHQFTRPGNRKIRVTVSDDDGGKAEYEVRVQFSNSDLPGGGTTGRSVPGHGTLPFANARLIEDLEGELR